MVNLPYHCHMDFRERQLLWVGTSKEDLLAQPNEVKQAVGYALHQVQHGVTPHNATSFSQGGSGVMEIKIPFDTDTYRTMYVAKLKKGVYILHSFQKKIEVWNSHSEKGRREDQGSLQGSFGIRQAVTTREVWNDHHRRKHQRLSRPGL